MTRPSASAAAAGSGPLHGVKVVEIAGIGPGPFCAMMLADMGATVLRIEAPRPDAPSMTLAAAPSIEVLQRGRPSLHLNLKDAADQAIAAELIAHADALVEGFRPGVMERLGLGPEPCLARNPKLVYGRMTGWGQHGPLAHSAGHDIDYIALSGMLAAVGEKGGRPLPPLNLVGDFGGGGMLLAFGIVCALLEAKTSGTGQVVDAAMTDGAALLGAMMYQFKAAGRWNLQRGTNLLDGGAPFYRTFACADGQYVAVGALEPQFYNLLLGKLGVQDPAMHPHMAAETWPHIERVLAAAFATRPRADWLAVFEGTDACVAAVLDMDEAPRHAHNVARGTFVEVGGVVQPAPAPRFSRSAARPPGASMPPGSARELLLDWGVTLAR